MRDLAEFRPDDHGEAGPYLERLRVAVVNSCGPVDVGCSGKGSGQITFCSAGRTTAYVRRYREGKRSTNWSPVAH